MSNNLLIVESPAKAKTLNKYLGKDFRVLASYGHVRDLIPKTGAVDVQNNFHMHYELIERNIPHVNNIVKAATQAQNIYLATDPDREGEAISWHLWIILQEAGVLEGKQVQRVVFHEITEKAIKSALSNPRNISQDLVDAQQARRALDYLVGFNLSPLLWRKVQPGLSAGRVQSPALRLIVEREREIQAFNTQEYWTIHAELSGFKALLSVYNGEKIKNFSFTNQAENDKAVNSLLASASGKLIVNNIQAKERARHPAAPFITSTLQQEAARKLRFSAQRTMRAAQNLYEAGFITYMRTDSVHLAEEALLALRELIKIQYGSAYLPAEARIYKTKAKNAQEAHEAIRPTDFSVNSNQLKLGDDERQLYELIWKRTVASQMNSAQLETTTLELKTAQGDNVFRASGSVIKFAGFMSLYLEDLDDAEEEKEALLPSVKIGEALDLITISGQQHFTLPPPRFSEASLIKTLEEFGIGRPSTYASIISTLINREYVSQENRRFNATGIGKIVNDFLAQNFEDYIDYNFTAKLEDELDAVSRGEKEWIPLLKNFWDNLESRILDKQDISRETVMQARELGFDPKSNKPVSVRFGRYGFFVQIGSKDDEEKPQFASIPKEYNPETINLESALELFKLPRDLGTLENGTPLSTNNGRFGPYIRYGEKFASIPKDENPLTITRERALEIIAAKEEEEQKKYIKDLFDGDLILQVLNGRFGPYVTDGKTNASIPKSLIPQDLTLEEALDLLAKARERKEKRLASKVEKESKKAEKENSGAEKKESKRGKKKSETSVESASDEEKKPKRGRKKKEESA